MKAKAKTKTSGEKCWMIGIDTCFLVDLTMNGSPRHEGALKLFNNWKSTNKQMYIFYNVFLEFQHIVTDPKRFTNPMTMEQAIEQSWFWCDQERVRIIYPDDQSFGRAQLWLNQYGLGRKRLIDTHMASCYANHGVDVFWTANPKDFEIFNVFDLIDYSSNK